MENREAINILNEIKQMDDSMYAYSLAYMEALNLAISALEKQEQTNAQSVNSMRTSRPNALESLNILEQAKDNKGCVPMSLVRQAFRNVIEQDRWIPITEWMPEENDFVLVTVSGEDVRGCEWKDSMALAVWTNQWNLVDANLVSYTISAWRPLPEPYKAEEEP